MWKSWVHFTARQAALQRRIMEQERMIALTKAIITLSRTCRALCRFMSPFTRGILFDHHSNPMHKLGWQFFLISQGRKLWCREVKGRAKTHTGCQWQASDPTPPPLFWLFLTFGLTSRREHGRNKAFSCWSALPSLLPTLFFPPSFLQHENFKIQKYSKRTITHHPTLQR